MATTGQQVLNGLDASQRVFLAVGLPAGEFGPAADEQEV